MSQAPTTNRYERYRNPDKRCGYPFQPTPDGYCWAYSKHVDRVAGFGNMMEICGDCQHWKGARRKQNGFSV